MKLLAALPLATMLALPFGVQAGVPDAKAKAFDARAFGGPIGEKASACFVRRYDAIHLAQHPKQKVGAMKLLLTATAQPNEPTAYAYKVGVNFRDRPGDFDGGSSCGHAVGDDGKTVIGFVCETGCGASGIEIAISRNSKSAIVHLDAIGIWDRKNPDGDATTLEGGADDRTFRLERVDASECVELMHGPEEVASLQRE